MTQQINGMVKEKLIKCDTHFSNDQIEAIMKVLEDSGYSDMYEALGTIRRTAESSGDLYYLRNALKIIARIARESKAKAEGK